jgi:Uma2 family endonuclease
MNKAALIAVEEPARFSAEEFMDMATAGAFENIVGKIELVEGVIIRMSPAHAPHFRYQRELFVRLHEIFGAGQDGFIVGQTPTVRLAADTVRDPDVGILHVPEGLQGIFDAAHFLLAAEVSDSSLPKDRGSKRLSYARAGIPHYWVVDIRGRKVELWSSPDGGDYSAHRSIPFGDPIPVPGTDKTITLD